MAFADADLAELRGLAFGVAYRMLGTVADAEDVAQDALLRMVGAQRGGELIESPRAYVATVATRRAIDVLRSARVRRESYVGEWLPEPIVTDPDTASDPAAQAELGDSLSMAFLVLLESLSPEQRAALLLHDVFDYPYAEVARIVGTTEVSARQLTSRARRHLREQRPRSRTTQQQRRVLADRFLAAANSGDLPALEALLAGDVELHGDGGGRAPALAQAVVGRSRVAKTIISWARIAARIGIRLQPAEVNGGPGFVTLDDQGAVLSVAALEIGPAGIERILGVVNPDKLQHLGSVGNAWDALGGRSPSR